MAFMTISMDLASGSSYSATYQIPDEDAENILTVNALRLNQQAPEGSPGYTTPDELFDALTAMMVGDVVQYTEQQLRAQAAAAAAAEVDPIPVTPVPDYPKAKLNT